MRLLLDTHLLLWIAGNPDRLSKSSRRLITNQANRLFYSAASLWEIAIKRSLERPDFQLEPERLRQGLLDHDYQELAITGAHAIAVEHLPPIHKDPFDRILIAQATVEQLTLITSDATLARYPGPIQKI
ncbi:PIN domain-containing protein [Pseudoduganella sp. FT93W]|uniref:PIN domain-containing protein n=1 Tax=Duganella fentianensis TaxID=2692177 RepID=A0A845I5F2_9BURK|nr:type II toxin-antitoxin system VapC family toxin [Duganella fentianensis]MYN46328.1 PIN domain-containing protein [Duganella fentianensis]